MALPMMGSKGENYETEQLHFSRKSAHQKGLLEIIIAQKCTHSIEIPSWSQGGWCTYCLVCSGYLT